MNSNKKSLFKRITSFLVVLCMMCGFMIPLASVTAYAAAPSSYTTIMTNSTESVSITYSGDAKYFKFVPTQSGTYRFYSTNYTSDPYGELLDASGNTLTTNDDGGDNYNFSITYECTANETYYVKACMRGSNTGFYTLNVQTVSVDCECAYILQNKKTADCENDGIETYVCSLCGNSYTNTVETALGHNYDNGICTRCGSVDYNTVKNINVATPNKAYPLFNSNRTGSGTCYSSYYNYDEASFRNGGYDLYADYGVSRIRNIRLGLSFTMAANATEKAQVTIYAYDVDEGSGERDCIRLVDETTGVKTVLTNTSGKDYLSGQDWRWSTTTFEIPAALLIEGHTYHFENEETVSGWVVYIRTVDLQINGLEGVVPPTPGPDPIHGISSSNFGGYISSTGTVYTTLDVSAYQEEAFALEYKATCLAEGDQKGGTTSTITVPTEVTSFTNSFNLQSNSPRGTYEVSVFIKLGGQVIVTKTFTASYGYSAVSYNENGGSNNKPTDTSTYSDGDSVTVRFDDVPSMYGYTFLGWSTDRNATEPMYTENGTKTFTIGASDVILYAVWKVDVCTHEWTETSRTDATCTTDGRINYECSCGETKVGVIPAIGHNIETTVEVEVTCTTDGLIVDCCVNDGCDYEKRTVIHGEHNYSVTDRQNAACETPGYVEYTCSNCGDKKYEYFDGAHNYVESARVEPQVDVEGSITYTCTLCGDSYDIILPALTPVLKNSSVLLIQDSLPWAENVNNSLLETLKDRGVVSSYNIINTSALASFDLTQYGVVFIANDQTTAMYERLAANAEKLEAYVRAGGNLVYGACDEGWGGCGSLTHTLPGGVTTSNYYSVHNYVVNGIHPIVTGVYTDNRSLRDELLKGNYCSHTYFNKATLPAGTDIILRDANGNPTLIEYNLGDGTVIASGLTWEYFYVRDHYNMVTNYSKYAYDDLVTYMVYMSNTCEHDYGMIETVDPTCEENGYTRYVCTLCSHEYKGNIVNALDHTPGEWIVDVAPTATQTGRRHKECTVCQTVLEPEVMPILAKLVIENVEAKAGKTVRVTIDIQNNPGIIGALLTIEYDPALTLISAEAGNAWNSLYFTAPNTFSNPCNFVWDGVSGADHSNGSIIVLTFEIPSGVDVGTVYNISASYTYGNMINENLEAVDLEIENGSITIIDPVGDVNDDGVVDVADVIVLRRYLAGGYEVVIDEFAADMDNDGYITVADVVLLRRFLVN